MQYVRLLLLSAGLLSAQQLEQQTSLGNAEPVLVTPDGTLVAVDKVACSLIRPCSRYLVYLFAPGTQIPVIKDLGGISDEKPAFLRLDGRGRIWAGGVNPDGSNWLTDFVSPRRLPPDMPPGILLDLAFDANAQPVILLWPAREANAGARLVKLDRDTGRILAQLDFGAGSATPVALAASPNGDLYLTGNTSVATFPVTPGAYQSTVGRSGWPVTFVARIAGDLSAVKAAAVIGGELGASPAGLAFGKDGSVYVAGTILFRTLGLSIFPTTPDAWQREVTEIGPVISSGPGPSAFGFPPLAGFVSRFDPTLSELLNSTLLAGESSDWIRVIRTDNEGRVIVTGGTDSLKFATTGAFRTQCGADRGVRLNNGSFITRLDARLRTVEASSLLTGLSINNGPAVYPDGSVSVMLDRAARWWPDRHPETSVTCMVGVDGRPATTVALGQVLTLFGDGFTTTPLLDFSNEPEYPSVADGLMVLYGGSQGWVAAPILAMTPYQVNVLLPAGDGTIGDLTLTVMKFGEVIDQRRMSTVARQPTAIVQITSEGQLVPGTLWGTSRGLPLADVLNEDGQWNRKDHPARPGSLVKLIVTGMGFLQPNLDERKPAPDAPARPTFPFTIDFGNRVIQPNEVSTIPGSPIGVLQILFRVPEDFTGPEMGFGLGNGLSYFMYVGE